MSSAFTSWLTGAFDYHLIGNTLNRNLPVGCECSIFDAAIFDRVGVSSQAIQAEKSELVEMCKCNTRFRLEIQFGNFRLLFKKSSFLWKFPFGNPFHLHIYIRIPKTLDFLGVEGRGRGVGRGKSKMVNNH